MNNKFLLLMMVIASVFVSCSNDAIRQESITSRNLPQDSARMPRDRTEIEGWETFYENLDAEAYVSLYPQLFGGNVFIVDSIGAAEDFIEQLSELDYEDLRATFYDLGFTNPYVESIITCDSVFRAVAIDYNIDLDDDNLDLSDITYESFFNEYVTILINNYASFVVQTQEEIETENDGSQSVDFVSPLGGFDLRMLLNDHNICVIDKIVFKIIGDYVLTVPIHKYEYLADVDDVFDVEYLLEHPSVYDIDNEEVPYNISYSPQRRLANSTPSSYDQTNFNSLENPPTVRALLRIDFSSYDKWGWWFITKRIGKARIRNYIYNLSTDKWIATKLKTTAHMHFYTTTSYQTPGHSIFPWLNSAAIYNKKIKDRTFSQTRSTGADQYYKNYPIYIYWSYVNASNDKGATINYGVRQTNF